MTLLDTLITSKTRIKLLLKFFSNASTSGYLRSLALEFGESTNSVRLELNRLSEAGLLTTEPKGNTLLYKANKLHPLFPEIKSIVSKYLGIDQIIEKVVHKLGDLKGAWIIRDYAQGKDTGVVDLVLVGDIDKSYLDKLVGKAEKLIHRKIRVLALTAQDFERLKEGLGVEEGILLWEQGI